MKTFCIFPNYGLFGVHYILKGLNAADKSSKTQHLIYLDDSGRWGNGGLFTALEARSDEPMKQYGKAGKMKGRGDQR